MSLKNGSFKQDFRLMCIELFRALRYNPIKEAFSFAIGIRLFIIDAKMKNVCFSAEIYSCICSFVNKAVEKRLKTASWGGGLLCLQF